MTVARHLLTIVGLVVLLILVDLLFRPIYPHVDPLRATMVGATSFAVLFTLSRVRRGLVRPVVGALAIFTSAISSVLLIQADILESQSAISGVVHVIILAVAYRVAYRSASMRDADRE